MGETENHYVDNDQFREDMKSYHDTQSPELLEFITSQYLIPIAEAVANRWTYMFSDRKDLIQTGLKAAIAAKDHPNTLSHPFNFFTRTMRNAMLDLSRSDSGKAQKSKDLVDGLNSGFIRRPESVITDSEDYATECPVIRSILHGDGTTKQGHASIPKIARETGLSKSAIQKRLQEIGNTVLHHARPSMRPTPATTTPKQPRIAPLSPLSGTPRVFTYTQLSLPLGPFPDETHQTQKLRRSNRPAKQDRSNHLPRQKHCNGYTEPYRRGLCQGPVSRLWN